MSEPTLTPNFAAWSSILGALPTAVLSPVTDPVLRGWLELILLRQEALATHEEAIVRRLDSQPDALAASLIAVIRAEISEGLAKAYLAGYQAACSLASGVTYTVTYPATPCTLCRGEGCSYGCAHPTS